MTCLHAHDDGVYVLGALAPTERLAFERHLDACPDCARRVRELAGLTGLLARVPAEVLEEDLADGPADEPPVPDAVLAGLVGRVRRDRRRRSWVTAGLAAAAVAVGVALGAVGAGLAGDDEPVAPTPTTQPTTQPTPQPTPQPTAAPNLAPTRPMRPAAGSDVPMTARLSLTGVPWGTRLDLTCSYPASGGDRGPGGYGSYGSGGRPTYTLVVRTRGGEVEQVATWRAPASGTMRLTAATATPRGAIAAVQVRTVDGSPVLQLGG